MTRPVVYVPRLHGAFVPEDLRPLVFSVPVGLAAPSVPAFPGEQLPVLKALGQPLPLKSGEARAVLDEMLQLGEVYASGGILSQLAALQNWNASSRENEAREELEALHAFALSGDLPASATARNLSDRREPGALQAAILTECQKLLLLAYALETHVLESARLEGRYRQAEQELRDAIGDDEDENLWESMPQNSALAGKGALALSIPFSWSLALDAMLPFLPDDCVLLTTDSAMAADLQARDLLRPLSRELAEAVIPDWPCVREMRYACAPAWRLTGRSRALPERPWLEREFMLLVASEAESPVAAFMDSGVDKD